MDVAANFFVDNGVESNLGETFITATMVAYGSFSIVGFIANLFVIITIAATKRLHTLTNFFIAQLAVGDLIILMFCMPFTVSSAYYFKTWIFGYGICWLVQMAGCVGPTISVLTIALMSYDRYMAITKPLGVKDNWPRWKVFLIFALVYAFAITRAVIRPLFSNPYREFEVNGTQYITCNEVPGTTFIFWYHLMGSLVCYFGIIILAAIFYYKIAQKLNSPECVAMMNNNPEAMKKRQHVTKMVFIIVFIIGFSWTPINIVMLLYISPEMPKWGGTDWFVIFLFVARIVEYGNCVANPILYSFLSTNFKAAAQETWSKCCPCVSAPASGWHSDYTSKAQTASSYAASNSSVGSTAVTVSK